MVPTIFLLFYLLNYTHSRLQPNRIAYSFLITCQAFTHSSHLNFSARHIVHVKSLGSKIGSGFSTLLPIGLLISVIFMRYVSLTCLIYAMGKSCSRI